MRSKYVSLLDLIKLLDNKSLSERYIRYIAGFHHKKQYRHDEILTVASLVSFLGKEEPIYSSFLYSYEIPRLNKEFDLLRFNMDEVINIELKSQPKDEGEMLKLLKQNEYYLKILNKKAYYFLYIASINTLLKLDHDQLVPASVDELKTLLKGKPSNLELDQVFAPSRILVSPLNDPARFLANDYLLTENQHYIHSKIIPDLLSKNVVSYYCINGKPGTGKSLLLFDIAKSLTSKGVVTLIHNGKKCQGHYELERLLPSLKIVESSDLTESNIASSSFILVDEAQRLSLASLTNIKHWAELYSIPVVFSTVEDKKMFATSESEAIVQTILSLCKDRIYNLTGRIRGNKEISIFISCLFELNKYQDHYAFPHIKIVFEQDANEAKEMAKLLIQEGYQYLLYDEQDNNKEGQWSPSEVIGQEFDKVVMVLDGRFYYESNRLCADNALYKSLLYQGLTRAKSEIALIIETKDLLQGVLTLFNS